TMSGAVAARTESSSPPVPRRSARSARSWPLKVLMPSAGGLLLLELSVVMRRPSFGREWWSGGLIGGGSGGSAGSRSGGGGRGWGRVGGVKGGRKGQGRAEGVRSCRAEGGGAGGAEGGEDRKSVV